MIFTETPFRALTSSISKRKAMIAAFLRAHFAKTNSVNMASVGHFCQVNNSLSAQKGTLRGMHYQLPPKAETKARSLYSRRISMT